MSSPPHSSTANDEQRLIDLFVQFLFRVPRGQYNIIPYCRAIFVAIKQTCFEKNSEKYWVTKIRGTL